jgi:hypothetical protein
MWEKIFNIRGKRYNCVKLQEEGITKVVCKPMEKIGEETKPLTERPIVFRIVKDSITGKTYADLLDDGMADKGLIKELDEYISYWLGEE